MEQFAAEMYNFGCVQAYNLDGGGSAAMVYNGEYFNELSSSERSLSDIIYFATAVDPEAWKE